MFKFSVTVFKHVSLLNSCIDLVDTGTDVTYWSQVLQCHHALLGDLEVKVLLENMKFKCLLNVCMY